MNINPVMPLPQAEAPHQAQAHIDNDYGEIATTLIERIKTFIQEHRKELFWVATGIGFISAPFYTLLGTVTGFVVHTCNYRLTLTHENGTTTHSLRPDEWFLSGATAPYAVVGFIGLRILSASASGLFSGFMIGSLLR